jgi:predicted transcriptional regulator
VTVHLKARTEDKIKSIELRKLGYTQPQIVKITGASKGIVSEWLKGVEVPEWYHDAISNKQTKLLLDLIQTPEWKSKMKQIGIERRKKPVATIDGIDYYSCTKCKRTLKENNFQKRKNGRVQSWCEECRSDWYKVTREEVVTRLGGECRCGCQIINLLEIHHININGKEERKDISYSAILKKIMKMPIEESKKEYEILCYVCHEAKHMMHRFPNISYSVTYNCK